jgi:RNA polymerase sigma factor (TIGR02999 family)
MENGKEEHIASLKKQLTKLRICCIINLINNENIYRSYKRSWTYMEVPTDFTTYINVFDPADKSAVDHIFSIIYNDLHNQAARLMAREYHHFTLNTTSLVHEAYLKLIDQKHITWKSRQHFFHFAALAMRRIVIDYARRRKAAKRGGGNIAISLDQVIGVADEPMEQTISFDQPDELLALDEALSRLEQFDEDLGKIVNFKFFSGRTNTETSELLGVSVSTVKRDWTMAKAWLKKEIEKTLKN